MITVFTPTYNRSYIIDELYKSLLSQTDKDFEWLVVDDGSSDDTENYFSKLTATETPFPVRYFKQKNGGKHRAINRGVNEAEGDLFFIVDSDDILAPAAIETVKKYVASLNGNAEFAGVAGLRAHRSAKIIGGNGDGKSYIDATNLERKKKNLLGDKAEVYFTEILRRYPFPEFDNETFLTEEVVWNKIAYDGYKLRWFSEVIYYTEYLEDGLTRADNSKYAKNPCGTLFWAKRQLEFFKDEKTKMSAIKRYYFAVKDVKTHKTIAKELGITRFKLFLVRVISYLKGSKS